MPEYHAHSANAHSANDEGQRHGLVEHLRAVAELAREFSSSFGEGETAHYAGLWHDLGKFDPEFQRYLSGSRTRGPGHKGAGTRLACQHVKGGEKVYHCGTFCRRRLHRCDDQDLVFPDRPHSVLASSVWPKLSFLVHMPGGGGVGACNRRRFDP